MAFSVLSPNVPPLSFDGLALSQQRTNLKELTQSCAPVVSIAASYFPSIERLNACLIAEAIKTAANIPILTNLFFVLLTNQYNTSQKFRQQVIKIPNPSMKKTPKGIQEVLRIKTPR